MSEIAIPVTYFSQTPDACVDLYDASQYHVLKTRQFEWAECGYYADEVETELTSAELNENYLPTALSGGADLVNRGVKAENFARWFNEAEGVSARQDAELKLTFANDEYKFESKKFQPVDGLFTMRMVVPVEVSKSGVEEFMITADDDTWVYVGSRLVLDTGGVHEPVKAKFAIHKNGEVYAGVGTDDLAYSGVTLDGDSTMVRIFHANRDSGTGSTFKLSFKNMMIKAVDGVAREDGYAEPLGTTLTIMNNHRQAVMSAMVAETAIVVVLALALAIFAGRKYLHRGRSRE